MAPIDMPMPPAPIPGGHAVGATANVAGSLVGLLAGIGIVGAVVGQPLAAIPAAGAVAAALATTYVRRRAEPRAAGALALLDPVTGVATREGLTGRLAAEVSRARRHGGALTVLHIDLVGFAAVNRQAGRPAGDELLRRVGLGMAAVLRGEDAVGRRGGDSFVVVLPGLTGADAARVTARLTAVAERVRVDGVVLSAPLRVSIGSSAYPADGASADALLEAAARRLGLARQARVAPAEPVAEPVVAPSSAGRWDLRTALIAELVLGALVAALWLALPLLGADDGSTGRMVLLAGLAVGVAGAAATMSLRTDGRERLGWRVFVVASLMAFVPVVGGLSAALFGVGILLVAGDGWLHDRFRIVDATIFAALVCGFVLTLALPGWDAVESAGATRVIAMVAKAIGVATVGATLLLVVTSVPRRARPDVWLLSAGYLVPLVTAIATIHGTGHTSPTADWKVVSVLAAANGLVAIGLRARHREPPSRTLRDGQADGALAVTAGTIGFVALMGAAVAVDDAVPAGVVALLIVITLLRHARTRIISVENRRLLQLALRSQAERAAQHRASLVALTTALEARDGYTGRHGEETVSLAVRVADALGLGGEDRREVDTVALLHDIGKIGTPNEVLHKPGPLTDAEWAIMREHPVVGERILRTVPGLESVARAVRHEHERWDGRGYPDGLAGEEIPLASRIVLVCDAYHAMTSDRPYRAAMVEAEALAELAVHAGSQFDPAVVHALVDVLAGDRAVAAAAAPAIEPALA